MTLFELSKPQIVAAALSARRSCLPSHHSETDTRKLIAGCFSVASNPFFDTGFFLVVVRMVWFGVEPSQLDDFVDRSRDGHRAALIAGKFPAVDFVSIGHGTISFRHRIFRMPLP